MSGGRIMFTWCAHLQILGLLAPEPDLPARFPPQCMTIELYPDGNVGLASAQHASGVSFCRSYYITGSTTSHTGETPAHAILRPASWA